MIEPSDYEQLKDKLLETPGVIESPKTHHEFRSGMHGRKIDIDEVPEGSELFWDLGSAALDLIQNLNPDMIITVANGANRFVPIFRSLRKQTVSVRPTIKSPQDKTDIRLTEPTVKYIQRTHPKKAVVFEDCATQGTNAAVVATQIRDAGCDNVEVVNLVYRQDKLERLDELDVVYHGIIRMTDELPTYSEADCKTQFYCAKGVKLIPYDQ